MPLLLLLPLLQARLSLMRDPDAPLFGFVGRLEEQKGVDIILSALPHMMGGPPAVPVHNAAIQHSGGSTQLRPTDSSTPGSSISSGAPSPGSSGSSAVPPPAGPGLPVPGVCGVVGGPQLVLLGVGQAWLQDSLREVGRAYPGRAIGVPDFNEPLSHLMMAACDFIIMPSRCVCVWGG